MCAASPVPRPRFEPIRPGFRRLWGGADCMPDDVRRRHAAGRGRAAAVRPPAAQPAPRGLPPPKLRVAGHARSHPGWRLRTPALPRAEM